MNLDKLNNFWLGLCAGILFPCIIFFFYWMFFHHQISFPQRFIRYLITGYLLSNIVKLCGLGNLLVFYFGLKQKLDSFNKGVILSVFLYIGLIAYITYYLEPRYI